MVCTGISCNQGRAGCDPSCENSKPRRTCAELGACQHRSPPCHDDCLPVLHQHNSDGSDRDQSADQPWDWIDDLWFATKWTLIGSVAAAAISISILRCAGVI